MKKIDPRERPNLWLSAVICSLIDMNTEDSTDAAKAAIETISQWLEPGLIDDLFKPWIDVYVGLLEADQNNESN